MPPKKKDAEEEKMVLIGRMGTNLKCGIAQCGQVNILQCSHQNQVFSPVLKFNLIVPVQHRSR